MDGLLRDAVARLAGTGQVVEVRALTDQYTHSGYFSDPDALIRSVEPLDADGSVHGIYVTLNEVNPALLSRGRTGSRCASAKKTARRATRISCAAAGCRSILTRCDRAGYRVRMRSTGLPWRKPMRWPGWITGLGFPDPVRADSGNGAHLLYRIDLPNDDSGNSAREGLPYDA